MSVVIKTAAPPQEVQGMVADPSIAVRPGGAPPLISPHCRKCNMPVERFTIDPIASEFYISVDVQCHGAQTGLRIPADQAVKALWFGQVHWFF